MEKQGLRDHFYYMRALDSDDRIITAGPFGPDGGLILVLARDQGETEGLIAADPAVFLASSMGKRRGLSRASWARSPLRRLTLESCRVRHLFGDLDDVVSARENKAHQSSPTGRGHHERK